MMNGAEMVKIISTVIKTIVSLQKAANVNKP